jgi:DNA repair exonuclease SbcCD ATPase subunit
MDILSLELNNFGPVEHAYLNLSGQGLVNIEGDNRDDPSANSNGSGKSTLADGLYWTLFGKTARGVKGDEVIANFAGKDCYGAVILQDGEDRYMVERWRKKKGFKGKDSGLALSRTGTTVVIDLTDGTDALTQAKIESILGCSEEVFTKAVYSGQEALPDLPSMTDKQIKELVEEAAGIEILAQAYSFARDNKRAKDGEASQILRDMQEVERRRDDAKAHLNDCETRKGSWSGEQAMKVTNKKVDLAAAVVAAKAIIEKMTALDVASANTSLDALRSSVSAVETERAEERRLTTEAASAARKSASSKSAFDAAMTAVRRAKVSFDGVEAKVGTPCDECGKPHTVEDVAEVKKLAAEKLRVATENARDLKAVAEGDSVEEGCKVADLESYRSRMTDVSAATAEMPTHEKVIREHAAFASTLENQKAAITRIKGEVAELEAAANPFVAQVEKAETNVGKLNQNVTRLAGEYEAAQEVCVIAEAACRVFGPAGVRAYVLDTVTPYLNDRTSHYLGTLSDGRIEAVWTTLAKNAKGELVERFAIEVCKEGGGKSFKALSGGEKRKVRLSCALALQDLVASRATKPIQLVILDEIDDALDEAGLERLMSVLEEKGREKGTVLVISHNSLKDWIRETVTVTMEGGKSTVSGALC